MEYLTNPLGSIQHYSWNELDTDYQRAYSGRNYEQLSHLQRTYDAANRAYPIVPVNGFGEVVLPGIETEAEKLAAQVAASSAEANTQTTMDRTQFITSLTTLLNSGLIATSQYLQMKAAAEQNQYSQQQMAQMYNQYAPPAGTNTNTNQSTNTITYILIGLLLVVVAVVAALKLKK